MHELSIAQIREKLEQAHSLSDGERNNLDQDSRIGVRHLLESWDKKQARYQGMIRKFREMNRFEDEWHLKGARQLAGIDEAGRGPLAGPVVAASVILEPDSVIPGINDSKQLSAVKRDYYFDRINESAVAFGIGVVSAAEIDAINIYEAAKKAMMLAVAQMAVKPDHLLIDAMKLPIQITQTSLIKGDARSNSIAAASILAKVTRDRLMNKLDQIYPGYGFADNKGYGTRTHLLAIRRLGPCPEHRMTFAPLKS
ncbi:ribonuclease HII [Sporolactobacillus pectinivorans]|uniref:ribonuclease HII n=1 Tax=Sporolactobacillus pectinivorans TaxID=1591408 RepID=UPI000C25F4EF|nr:ribonuclease HII [Sporolactobacillus pectinivorans]